MQITPNRVRLVPVVLACLALGSPARAVDPKTTFTDIHSSRSAVLGELKTPLVAISFLADGATSATAAQVKSFADGAPGVAGVTWVFSSAQPVDAHKALLAEGHADNIFMIHDENGALAAGFNVALSNGAAAHPVTVVIDRTGAELARVEGSADGGAPTFGVVASTIDKLNKAPIEQYNLPKDGVGVNGYDVTAYFELNKPVKGKPEFTSRYRGVKYQFASVESRAKFNTDPDAYVPTYGGWCASAMGDRGEEVEIDPTNFKVTHGRLFLFYKSFFADAKKDWDKKEQQWEPAADQFWKKISGEPPVRTR